MSKLLVEETCNKFEESCLLMKNATLDGNFKINNKEGEKIKKIFKGFKQNAEFSEECINILMHSSNVVTRIEIAAYCLSTGVKIECAKKVLSEISDDRDSGVFGFNASMTLKVWEKNNGLKIF